MSDYRYRPRRGGRFSDRRHYSSSLSSSSSPFSRPQDTTPSKRLFAMGIPIDISDDEIRSWFEGIGRLTAFAVRVSRKMGHKIAWVSMGSIEEAQRARDELDGNTFVDQNRGRNRETAMKVVFTDRAPAGDDDTGHNSDSDEPERDQSQDMQSYDSQDRQYTQPVAPQVTEQDSQSDKPKYVYLFATGFSTRLEDKDIKVRFSRFDPSALTYVFESSRGSQKCKMATVRMGNIITATQAIRALHDTEIDGRRVSVEFHKDYLTGDPDTIKALDERLLKDLFPRKAEKKQQNAAAQAAAATAPQQQRRSPSPPPRSRSQSRSPSPTSSRSRSPSPPPRSRSPSRSPSRSRSRSPSPAPRQQRQPAPEKPIQLRTKVPLPLVLRQLPDNTHTKLRIFKVPRTMPDKMLENLLAKHGPIHNLLIRLDGPDHKQASVTMTRISDAQKVAEELHKRAIILDQGTTLEARSTLEVEFDRDWIAELENGQGQAAAASRPEESSASSDRYARHQLPSRSRSPPRQERDQGASRSGDYRRARKRSRSPVEDRYRDDRSDSYRGGRYDSQQDRRNKYPRYR